MRWFIPSVTCTYNIAFLNPHTHEVIGMYHGGAGGISSVNGDDRRHRFPNGPLHRYNYGSEAVNSSQRTRLLGHSSGEVNSQVKSELKICGFSQYQIVQVIHEKRARNE
jgi:hypothetical protein